MSRLALELLSLLLIAVPSAYPQPAQEPIATPQATGAAVTPERDSPREQSYARPHDAMVSQQPPSAEQLNKKTSDDNGQGEALELNRRLTDYTGNLAHYTWLLVIIGFLQGAVAVFQIALFFKSLGISREATAAAKAALHTNRPFLLVTNIVSNSTETDGNWYKVESAIRLRNFGVGPADIVDYIAKVELFDTPESSSSEPLVTYGLDEGNRLGNPLIGPGDAVEDRFFPGMTIGPDMRTARHEKRKTLATHGRIRYRGAPEQVYITRFFWWHFTGNQGNERAKTPELNAHT
jgi:hypothetical protein